MSVVVPVLQTLSYQELATVAGVNVAVCAACFIIFGIVRSIKRNRYFFAPLFYRCAEEKTCPLHGEPSTVPSPDKPDVPSPGKGPFAWILPTLRYRQEDLLVSRGLDPIMHLRTLKLMMMILGCIAVPGLAILVPINATASYIYDEPVGTTNSTHVSGVGALSMSNINDNSPRMWAHAISVWIFTAIALVFAYREYAKYAQLRTRYNGEHKAHNYTIMVKDVPSFITSSEQLEEYFRKFFGRKIVSAHMPIANNELRKLLKKKEKTYSELQEVETLSQKGPLKSAVHMKGIKFWFSKKQDAIIYYEDKLDKIDKAIVDSRQRVRHNNGKKRKNMRVGFVTFRSMGEAYVCAQSVLSADSKSGKPVPAPELDDICWPHLTRKINQHFTTGLYVASLAFFCLIIIFWGSLTAFLTSVASLNPKQRISWLSWLYNILRLNPWLEDIVQKYLPYLLVVILQSFLPDIIYGVLKLRGEITRSGLEKSAMRIHFIFLVFNVFLVFTITSTTISVWTKLIDLLKQSLPQLVELLGSTLPSASNSFISYLLVYGLSSLPQQLLRLGPYVVSVVRTHTAITNCEKWDASRPEYPMYGIWYANCLLIFLLSITYSVVAPITVPFGILVLFFEFLLAKYRYMYVTPQRFHSGAICWPMLYNRMIVCLLVSHCTILGVFTLKSFYPGTLAILPLPLATVLFARHTSKKYKKRSRYLPISEFPIAYSELEGGMGSSYEITDTQNRFKNAYKDPAMTETDSLAPSI